MKRLVVGLLLAATAYVPLAVGAQRREESLQGTTDIDREEPRQRRAERQERRAARLEAGGTVQAPAADRPRRDRDGVEGARPDPLPEPVTDRTPRSDWVDRRGQRPRNGAGFADYGTDPRDARADRREERRDLRRDRRDRLGVDDRYRSESDGRDRLDDRDRRRGFDGRSADLYRGGQVWNRGWRNDDRYDWNSARLRDRNAYRLPRYHAPPGAGYGYRRFGVGVQLSRSLFQQGYWLDDPYSYRLPPAYGPYRWVRYHGDALLVDLRTGRVIDVVYDIFY